MSIKDEIKESSNIPKKINEDSEQAELKRLQKKQADSGGYLTPKERARLEELKKLNFEKSSMSKEDYYETFFDKA